ncbi:MAG: ABC transporter permease [Trueperaceae bacterium]|nr:MAG: ABC transporter permease [Trueperaceae bacterium]
MRAAASESNPEEQTFQTVITLSRLAWRNIWRQRRRTGLLVAVVAYATLATIYFWGFNDGFNNSILQGQARFLAAPMLVTTARYHQDPNPENALPDLDIAAELATTPSVTAVAPRLEFPALVRSPYASQGLRVRGIDPQLEPAISEVPGKIGEGRLLQARGEAIMGIDLASRLDVRLGERLVVEASSLAGPQAAGFKVVGFIDTGLAGVDARMVLIHLDDARMITGVETATGLALQVPNGQDLRLRDSLQAKLSDELVVLDLFTLLGALATRVRVSRIIMLPVALLFAVFAALAVTSTLVASVMERMKEFGMVAAIGLPPQRLAVMVVIEALLTTLIGWLLGLVLGYALIWTLSTWNVLGPLFASAASGLVDTGIGEEVYTNVSARYALIATATVALAGVLAILFPARRIRDLDPVTTMRD